PERALAAVRAVSSPLVLIAGGRSKHLFLDELATAVAEKACAGVTVGEMAEEIEEAFRPPLCGTSIPVRRAAPLTEAVQMARELVRPGDAIVLSPGGTSFDQFRDFEERGRQFKALVDGLEPAGA